MTILQTGPLSVNTILLPIGDGRTVIVDPAGSDLSNDRNVILDYMRENSLKPVCILLTHGHFDHVIGVPAIKAQYPDCPVGIAAADAEALGHESLTYHMYSLQRFGLGFVKQYLTDLPASDFILPYDADLSNIPCGDFTGWSVIHTPGHTAGSVCLYNKDRKILLSGDTLFYKGTGRTDLYGGSEEQLMHSVQKLKQLVTDDTLVYPGHGEFGFPFNDAF